MMKMPPIAVLAGGLGTRLGPLTQNTPKVMVSVAGEPFIAHQLRLFQREGIEHAVLCCGHRHEMIRSYLGDGDRFGIKVDYSLDGNVLMGTGGALRHALPLLGEEFLVIYGDSYLDIPYDSVVETFRASKSTGLMTVFHNQGRWDTSNVEFEDGRIVEYSKQPTPRMHYIDYGLSMLRPGAFRGAPADRPFDLSEVFRGLVQGGDIIGFAASRRFYEIGSPAGLKETEDYILAHKAR